MHSITLHNLKHTYLLLAPGSAAEKWSSSEAWELTYSELGPLMAPWTFVETLLLNEPLISDLLFFGKGRQALFVSPRKKTTVMFFFHTTMFLNNQTSEWTATIIIEASKHYMG